VLRPDSSFIFFFESFGSNDSTTDRSSSIKFFLHVLYTSYRSILRYFSFGVFFYGITYIIRERRRGTVHAVLDIRARKFFRVLRDILLASYGRNSFFLGKRISSHGVASVTRSSSVTVDNCLNCKSRLRPGIFSYYVNSIC
jgi:hypothetical protein